MSVQIFQLSTLVDITATGVVRSTGDRDLERNQQRNFETVLQVLSLRTQPHIIKFPETLEQAYKRADKRYENNIKKFEYETNRITWFAAGFLTGGLGVTIVSLLSYYFLGLR